MVTYLYWTAIFITIGTVFFGIGIKGKNWKVGSIVSSLILLTGWEVYYFRLEQIFVKKIRRCNVCQFTLALKSPPYISG